VSQAHHRLGLWQVRQLEILVLHAHRGGKAVEHGVEHFLAKFAHEPVADGSRIGMTVPVAQRRAHLRERRRFSGMRKRWKKADKRKRNSVCPHKNSPIDSRLCVGWASPTVRHTWWAMPTLQIAITAQASPVGKSLKIAAWAVLAAVAWSRIFNGLGRILWGGFSDLVGREMAMVIPFTLQAFCLLGVLAVGKLTEGQTYMGIGRDGWFIAMMILIYCTWGSMFSLFPAIIGDYFGPNCATSNYGFLYTAKGVSSIGGGGIAAALFLKYGSWNIPVYWTAGLTLVSAALILGLRFIPLPSQRRQEDPMLVTAKAG
jgi:hypothetical protein